MEEKIFKGIYGIALTPFQENGGVDYHTLEKQVACAVESPELTGIIVCGSTGEFSRMSFEENTRLMETVKNVVGTQKQFICGVTAGDSHTANQYVEHAAQLGADGVLAAPPYYFKLSDDEILEYYKDILRENRSKLPVIGYNIPQCTNPVSVQNFKELLQYNEFKGFKNSWHNMQEITAEIALRNEKRPDVSMMTGVDACLYGTLALGGDGIFSAITYLMPEVIDVIYSHYGKGPEAFACQCDLIKLIDVVNRFTFPYGYRLLSEAIGMPLGPGREPVPASVGNRAKRAVLEIKELFATIADKYLS